MHSVRSDTLVYLFWREILTAPLNQAEKDARLIARLKVENSQLRTQRDAFAKKQGMAFEIVIDELKGFLEKDSTFQKFVWSPVPKAPHKPLTKSPISKDHQEIASLILSDLHLSETVKPKDVNGINAYNSMICANRLFSTVDSFINIVNLHRSMYKISEVWVPVLGDIINGTIQQDALLTNDLLDVPATVLAGRLLKMALQKLRAELGLPIRVDCVVGNHSRILARMPTKRQAHLGYDWMVYEALANAFEHDPMVKVNVHTGPMGLVERFNHRYVLLHGVGVDHSREDYVEASLRNIYDSPEYRNATKMEGSSVDMVIMGDLHRARKGEHYIVNGCLPGQNELGMSWYLSPIGSIQQAFGISRKHRTTWTYEIDSTDVRSEKSINAFSEYTSIFMHEHGRA